eukprot:1662695-Amphidinium_carterae.2
MEILTTSIVTVWASLNCRSWTTWLLVSTSVGVAVLWAANPGSARQAFLSAAAIDMAYHPAHLGETWVRKDVNLPS